MWIREACWWLYRFFLIQIDISLFFHDKLRGYMSHSTIHHPHEGPKTCKVCSSPHSDEHRSSHLGVCHTCWYKILIVIFIIMIALSYVAWFGILWFFFREKKILKNNSCIHAITIFSASTQHKSDFYGLGRLRKTIKFRQRDFVQSVAGEPMPSWLTGLWPSPEWRRAPAVFAFLCLQMMNNGSTDFKWMMTRWSTDACRRDPSIVSSNLTNPTFSLTIYVFLRRFLVFPVPWDLPDRFMFIRCHIHRLRLSRLLHFWHTSFPMDEKMARSRIRPHNYLFLFGKEIITTRPPSKIDITCQNPKCCYSLKDDGKNIVNRGNSRAGHQQYFFLKQCQKLIIPPTYHE